MNDIVQHMSGSVQRMPASRRMMLFGGLVVVVATVIGVGLWASEPSWVTLYSGVTLGDASQMTAALDKAAIHNKLGPDGSAVLVAKQDYARAKVLLAKDGLPGSEGMGWGDIFGGSSGIGDTESRERMKFERALEGELGKTIAATTGVARADVHLTIPEPSAFRRNEQPSKAAIRLKMRPGMLLVPGAVQGIIATVSNSVQRLSPENVVVTDETGRLLSSAPDEGSVIGGAGRRMELQQSIETYLATKAEGLLGSVSGLGAPRVLVSANLNFDQVERTYESFEPDGQVLSNEGRSETEAGAEGGGGQTIVNNTYQNSRRLERVTSTGGGITRLMVSVMVDERALAADTGSATPVASRLADVEALVKNAVGFDSARGDRIKVVAAPQHVATVDSIAPPPAADPLDLVDRFARPAVGLFAIIALLIVALRAVSALQLGRRMVAADGGSSLGSAMDFSAAAAIPLLGPPPETVLLKNKVTEESSGKPQVTAQVVRAWMAEGN